ncbi:hypothetical protein [Ferruginibacter sp. SUN106]|uniref:hypothetical protein n=1 Tax=Ferruginibacter sp. SUN106 TaxID=2978348 RepID=UPI003D368FB6
MKKRNESSVLQNAILSLQRKQAQELDSLKEQFHITYESLKPINLIKNTFRDATSSPEVKSGLVNNAIGLATGYLSKKLLIGGTHNPIKKILGAIVEFSVASFVAKRADNFKPAAKEELKENEQPVF